MTQGPIRLKRRLGQHLLLRRSTARSIVRSLEAEAGEMVLEIGPGRGALTIPLLECGARVVAVERDPAMADELEERLSDKGDLHVVRGDILAISIAEVCVSHRVDQIKVIGNIPYRITSPILHWLLAEWRWVGRAVLTVQTEVARRLLAAPGSKAYGALTLAVGQHAAVERVRELPAGAFRPAPKVSSTVIRLLPRPHPRVEVPDPELLETLIRRSFAQRRKMLRSSLMAGSPWSREDLDRAAAKADISLGCRAEELALEDFGRLCCALWAQGFRPGEKHG